MMSPYKLSQTVFTFGLALSCIVPGIIFYLLAIRPKGSTLGERHAIVGAICFILGLIMSGLTFGLSEYVEANTSLPYIQAALDEECGKGVVVADTAGFSHEMISLWSGLGGSVGCSYLSDEEGWTCSCNE
jgi:hypothetical protein